MNKVFILVLVISFTGINGFSQTFQKGPYTITSISENVYHIEDGNDSNPPGQVIGDDGQLVSMNNCSDMYLVVGKEKALLIDLSNAVKWDETAVESLQSVVYEKVENREFYITITHRHGDHLGMLPAFVDDEKANFWIPKTEFEGMDIFPSERTSYFDKNESFDLGDGFVINTTEVPGHTAHSTLFFLKDKNIVFSGDAIGSGSGVWLFNAESFPRYAEGISNLVQYIEDPKNEIDTDKLIVYGGHAWQSNEIGKLTAQYIYDMKTLVEKIGTGNATSEPYTANFDFLNTNFKYGTATITWNKVAAENYAKYNK